MNTHPLIDTANFLVANDKGLLAMDESTPTCNRRFAKEGIPQTQETRRAYREMIVTTPGLGACISGAIQQPALTIWHGEAANVAAAQQALLHRAHCNRAARRGDYTAAMESIR